MYPLKKVESADFITYTVTYKTFLLSVHNIFTSYIALWGEGVVIYPVLRGNLK